MTAASTHSSTASSPHQQAMPAKRRLDYVDALRGAACLWVLLHHTFEHKPAPAGFWHYPAALVVLVANIGWLGVSMFLVLSGFCLFYPLAARYEQQGIQLKLSTFARRRALRILPPYYIALLLLVPLDLFVSHHRSHHWDWHAVLHGPKDILLHLFMLHNLSASTIGSVTPALWSLALECQLYLVFPLLVWSVMRFGLKSILAATFVVAVVWQSLCYRHFGFSLVWTPQLAVYYHALPGRCFEFAAGMAAASFVARPRPGQGRIALALILIPLVPALYFVSEVSRFGPLCDQAWGVIFAAALVLLGHVPDALFQRSAGLRSLVWVGAISYSVYLLHQPLINLLSLRQLHIQESAAGGFAEGLLRLPLLVGIGYLFHLFFERPFMPGRPRTERQAEVAAAISPAP